MADEVVTTAPEAKPDAEFKHALKLYQGLHQLAKEEKVNGRVILMFEGMLTNVFDAAGIPRSYYTPIIRKLEAKSCITKIQQGTRGSNTVIALHESPSWDSWQEPSAGLAQSLTRKEQFAKIVQRIEVLENRVGGFNLVEALTNIESRLRALEGKTTGKGE